MPESKKNPKPNRELAALRRRVAELEAAAARHDEVREELRQEHSFRRSVIENAAEGLSVCHAIEEYPFVRFTVWNRSMERITGFSMAEINRFGWYQMMYPDPEVQERARLRMAKMREGDNLRNERWEITRSDGEKRILGISTSILTSNDGIVHVLGLMHDVTAEERYRRELEHRLVRLEGLLPICSACKQIRDGSGTWHEVEAYFQDHSEARFTHGICPRCSDALYPELTQHSPA